MNLTPSPFAPDKFPTLPVIAGVRAATGSRGFYASRGLERDDVFLFHFDAGTSCAGVFTRSATASADVLWCRDALSGGGGKASGLVVNSGNSNAFTGPKGVLKNDATLSAMVDALSIEKHHCFLGATGVIGEPLPDPNYVGSIIPDLAQKLSDPDWEACAKAFMTTDTFAKGAGFTREIDGVQTAFSGIAKGSGMIAPDMATMLGYIFTDADVAPGFLQELLNAANAQSFSCITVDGDTSTSDTILACATGKSGAPRITGWDSEGADAFAAALGDVCRNLAQLVVRDGEGASKFIEVRVSGAVSDDSARRVGLAIANSPLVKTAIAGEDANWGRVVMAVGKAGEPADRDRLSIAFGGVWAAREGVPVDDYDEAPVAAHLKGQHIDLAVELGMGDGAARVWTCDLTHGYISINADYRS